MMERKNYSKPPPNGRKPVRLKVSNKVVEGEAVVLLEEETRVAERVGKREEGKRMDHPVPQPPPNLQPPDVQLLDLLHPIKLPVPLL